MCNCQNCQKIDEHFTKVLLKAGIDPDKVKNMLGAFEAYRQLTQEVRDELFNVEFLSPKKQAEKIIDDINKDLDETFKKENVKTSPDDERQEELSIKINGSTAVAKLSGTTDDKIKIAIALTELLQDKRNEKFLDMMLLFSSK